MLTWVTLPSSWNLQDVQAVLTVIIAAICAGSTFVVVRVFWMNAAYDVVCKSRRIPAHNLLSLNNIGEVTDVFWLLRFEMFSSRYARISIQSVFVILLSVTGLLSGLIARYSTQNEMLSIPRNISGILAERTLQSAIAGFTVNETFNALKNAKFPPNQLLDFLPDSNSNWDYRSAQWTNSSWSMDCTFTELQEIPNVSVQDCSENISEEVPYLINVLRDWPADAQRFYWSGSGYEYNLTQWKDYVLFLHASWGLRYENNSIFDPGDCGCPASEMSIRSFWFHFEDAPRSDSNDSSCVFTRGSVRKLSFTGASCVLSRVASAIPEDQLFNYPGAAPDVVDDQGVAARYNLQFGTDSIRESIQNVPLTVISGEELALFYQAQMIAKDTELSSRRTAFRTINAFTPVTQISLVCLVFCCIGAFLIILGAVCYYTFIIIHQEKLNRTPQSKLDWMLLLLRACVLDEDRKVLLSASYVQESGNGLLGTTTHPVNDKGGISPTAETEQFSEPQFTNPALPTNIALTSLHNR